MKERVWTGEDVRIDVKFGVTVKPEVAAALEGGLRQVLEDLGLQGRVEVRRV